MPYHFATIHLKMTIAHPSDCVIFCTSLNDTRGAVFITLLMYKSHKNSYCVL